MNLFRRGRAGDSRETMGGWKKELKSMSWKKELKKMSYCLMTGAKGGWRRGTGAGWRGNGWLPREEL
jgi:hypothetical protein